MSEEIKKSNQTIESLKNGNLRFLEGKSTQSSDSSLKKLKEFSKNGQNPKAIVLCCSDSRAPVEMIFDQDIGDLFVIRVAGNIVAPSLVGSVEFAASMFKTNLVLVMGHTQCGAIAAALANFDNTAGIESENIHDIVDRIKPNIFLVSQMQELSKEDRLLKSVEANVRASVSQLAHSSRIVEGLVQQSKIKIVGAILDISTGQVRFLEA